MRERYLDVVAGESGVQVETELRVRLHVEPQVRQDQVERLGLDVRERLFAPERGRDAVAVHLQDRGHGHGDALFVVDDEDPRGHRPVDLRSGGSC